MNKIDTRPSRIARIAGLDQLRFVLAIWVTVGHCALAPNLSGLFTLGSPADLAIRAVWNNAFNGPAAVIVFFVISGFCIHLPYKNASEQMDLLPYFSRRYIRYPLTLNIFALIAVFWLRAEICYYKTRQPIPLLESAGQGSYSLYLTHLHAMAFFLLSPLAGMSALARGIFILVFAYGFFVLVERPSHKWAREFSKSEMLARIGRSYSGKLSFTE